MRRARIPIPIDREHLAAAADDDEVVASARVGALPAPLEILALRVYVNDPLPEQSSNSVQEAH
ncbi:MAG: hypothetical protein GC206_16020 [Alphaproteobacteria bacterium]|nr:hypothetical protein [Alphaproteobacteria bacterium]